MIPNTFIGDERAVEGLPIRLLISLTIGVAALSLMMGMLDDLRGVSEIEVNWQPSSSTNEKIVGTDDTNTQQVSMRVIDETGDPLEGGQILIIPGTAQLDGGPFTKEITDRGQVTISLGKHAQESLPDLRPGQNRGTLQVEIIPPNGDYVDNRENQKIVVVSGNP